MSDYKIKLEFIDTNYLPGLLVIESGTRTFTFEYEFFNTVNPYYISISQNTEGIVNDTTTVFNDIYAEESDYTFRPSAYILEIHVKSGTTPTVIVPKNGINVSVLLSLPLFIIQSIDYPINISNTPCSSIIVRVITNQNIEKLTSPYLDETLSGNSNLIELNRGVYNQIITVENELGESTFTLFGGVPPAINPNSIVVDINNEYDIVVSFYSEGVLFVEYSLNDGIYQTSNIFLGLNIGSNNIKIKDEFGCIVEKQFTVNEYTPSIIPRLYVSKSNSFRFKEVNNLLPNDNNLFSCESLDSVVHGSIQNYNKEEVITTQVKSNIEPNAAINGVNLNITKLSNNIGVTECIEAKNYIRGLYDSLFYFTTGYYKDCITGDLLNEYELNGALPEWVVLGQKITIDNQDTTIISIEFISKLNATAFKCSNSYTGNIKDIKVVYNKEEYEVYEFNTIMDEYKNLDSFRVDITATSQVGVGAYKSEPLRVIDTSDMVKIEYWMDRNTDIFYASGIRNISHQQLKKSVALSDGSVDDYKTDTDIIQIDQELFEVEEFTFEPIPKENARKLVLAMIHNNVIINDIGYKAKELPSMEVQGDSNLYVVVAIMYKGANDIAINRFYDYSTMIPKLVENKPTNFIAQ